MFNPWTTTKVTLELRELVENGVDMWKFDYPSYYEGEEKTAFEQKVIDHFYLRQIGQETPGRFLHMFRSRVREIMPRYIDMYHTVEIMRGLENPFDNVDVTETFRETTSSESTGTTTGTSKSDSTIDNLDTHNISEDKELRVSDTPGGHISNLDAHISEGRKEKNQISNNMTNLDHQLVEGESDTTSTGTSSGTTEHTYTKKGNQGVNTYAHDMIEFRKSIIDVDMMIINDLECLFLQIY